MATHDHVIAQGTGGTIAVFRYWAHGGYTVHRFAGWREYMDSPSFGLPLTISAR